MYETRVEITDGNFETVIKRLSNAINWLNSDQPENAVMFHLGMNLSAVEVSRIQISVGLIPIGGEARPTLVFNKGFVEDKSSLTGMSYDCFVAEEIDVIRSGIVKAGGSIFSEWNGTGSYSASFALAQFAGKGVQSLVHNYSRHMRQYGFSWPPEITALYALAVKPEYWY